MLQDAMRTKMRVKYLGKITNTGIRPWRGKGVDRPSASRNLPPFAFQLLAFSCVFPLECPLYDTLAHSTHAWLLVTQTHLQTRS